MIHKKKEKIGYLRCKVLAWHKHFQVDYPWRKTKNRWHALVAEIMLQRTNADQVVPVYESFCSQFPHPTTFSNKARNSKKNYFSKLGLTWRNKFLIRAADVIAKKAIPLKKKIC